MVPRGVQYRIGCEIAVGGADKVVFAEMDNDFAAEDRDAVDVLLIANMSHAEIVPFRTGGQQFEGCTYERLPCACSLRISRDDQNQTHYKR